MAFQSGNHIITGLNGESMAAAYLQEKGYTILSRNYRYKRAEIDIIAEKPGLLVFVEVKTRTSDKFGFPEEAVTMKKQELILAAAEEFILQKGWEQDIRFDIISITLSNPPELHHIEDAFY
ncbi:YraN family protein [Pontibacter vulgaris]|uniref:YraN family protein n=1 Tax=Pontibacter vulgaris TaxID=2905679 RepID=UPI001FA78A0D|nr:YraN family protein [Pontibacter vulgaris]